MKPTSVVLLTVGILLVLAGFMALDRTVLHWYVPEAGGAQSDEVAQELLGNWDRSVAEEVRAEGRDEFLQSGVDAPAEGSAEQFRSAMFRLANIAALVAAGDEINRMPSARQKLERLHDCIGYLLATHQSGASCNLVTIAE